MRRISQRIFRILALAVQSWAVAALAYASGARPTIRPPDEPLLGYATSADGNSVPIAALVHIQGVRENHLIGYGVVTGLQNTGDTQQSLFTIQEVLNILRRDGITLPPYINPIQIQTRNVASAVVTAELPPFAVPGAKIDVEVSSMGDASSLQGGTLLMTPLHGADGKVYAIAQGPVAVEGYFVSASGGASARKNFTTAGTIPGGATVETSVPNAFQDQRTVVLALDDANPIVASRIAAAIGRRYPDADVYMANPGTVKVKLPDFLSSSEFLAALGAMRVTAQESDRVVINERTGTVIVGGEVRVGRAAITHGNITVLVSTATRVSQPAPFSSGTTAVTKNVSVGVNESPGAFFVTPESATVEQVASTLNIVGAKPEDVIAIFQGLKDAGALHGKLIIR